MCTDGSVCERADVECVQTGRCVRELTSNVYRRSVCERADVECVQTGRCVRELTSNVYRRVGV